MKKARHTYIAVMGTMGSGKTTAAQVLAAGLGFDLMVENFKENAFLPRFYGDMKRWAFHSQTFFLMEKVTQMLKIPRVLEKKSIVQDTPIQQDVFSYAKAHRVLGNMDEAQWRLYQKIYSSFESYFPKPDLIVYLETSMPHIVDRIEKRARGYEQQIPQKYLSLLDRLNHAWLTRNKSIPILHIQTDELNIAQDENAKKQLLKRVRDALKHTI